LVIRPEIMHSPSWPFPIPPPVRADRGPPAAPGRVVLSDRPRVASLHLEARLSARQNARGLDVGHSAVPAARGGRNGHAVKGQAPFGWDLHDARFVKNGAERQVIRLMRQLQRRGESLHGIARELNRRLLPTKNAGVRRADAVRLILHRLARLTA
jgi:hypothetical protein